MYSICLKDIWHVLTWVCREWKSWSVLLPNSRRLGSADSASAQEARWHSPSTARWENFCERWLLVADNNVEWMMLYDVICHLFSLNLMKVWTSKPASKIWQALPSTNLTGYCFHQPCYDYSLICLVIWKVGNSVNASSIVIMHVLLKCEWLLL